MVQPEDNRNIDRLADSVADLATETRGLREETINAERLRETKIKWIQRQLYVIIPSVLLLVVMAVTNFVLLSRLNHVAHDTASTNRLIAGCLTPNTQCSNLNAKQQIAVLNQIRQTQLAIALCQRQNPIPMNASQAEANASAAKIVTCVQQYYPGFQLPPKVK